MEKSNGLKRTAIHVGLRSEKWKDTWSTSEAGDCLRWFLERSAWTVKFTALRWVHTDMDGYNPLNNYSLITFRPVLAFREKKKGYYHHLPQPFPKPPDLPQPLKKFMRSTPSCWRGSIEVQCASTWNTRRMLTGTEASLAATSSDEENKIFVFVSPDLLRCRPAVSPDLLRCRPAVSPDLLRWLAAPATEESWRHELFFHYGWFSLSLFHYGFTRCSSDEGFPAATKEKKIYSLVRGVFQPGR